MTLLAVAFALSAALLFGWSTAAMQHDSFTAPAEHKLGALAAHLVRRWRWVSGFVASFAGLAFHAAALSVGSLLVVQPLVVTCLVIALVIGDALARRRPQRATLAWSGLIAAALAVFLVTIGATHGTAKPDQRLAALILVLGAVGACACWWGSRRVPEHLRGLLLGAGTGINFGLIAGTLKAVTAAHSITAALTSWPLYVLIVLGISGFIGNQVAYRNTTLSSSLPVLNVVNPVVAVLFGIVAFRERPDTQPLTVIIAVAAMSAVLLGLVKVTQLELAPTAPAAKATDAALVSEGVHAGQ